MTFAIFEGRSSLELLHGLNLTICSGARALIFDKVFGRFCIEYVFSWIFNAISRCLLYNFREHIIFVSLLMKNKIKAKTKIYSVKRQKGKMSMRNAPFLFYFIFWVLFQAECGTLFIVMKFRKPALFRPRKDVDALLG